MRFRWGIVVAAVALVACASSGSITLTQVTPTVTVGSFDLLFPAGDHLTGTFTAPLCPSASQAADAATCP
jgi:hypothetical protein